MGGRGGWQILMAYRVGLQNPTRRVAFYDEFASHVCDLSSGYLQYNYAPFLRKIKIFFKKNLLFFCAAPGDK